MATYLLDTNVLLRFLDTNSPLNPLKRQAVTALRFQGHSIKICSQNIVELWAVATRPLAANGFGWSLTQTRSEVDRLLAISRFACYFYNVARASHHLQNFRQTSPRRKASSNRQSPRHRKPAHAKRC